MGLNDVDRAEWARHTRKVLDLAFKLKKVMLKRGLRRAKAPCPDCEGKFLNGTLNGSRDHMHFVCDCRKLSMME
ncbi:MAG TPA: hypothetical protein VF944_04480 [Candidatus Bathyarchaeia archaeon]